MDSDYKKRLEAEARKWEAIEWEAIAREALAVVVNNEDQIRDFLLSQGAVPPEVFRGDRGNLSSDMNDADLAEKTQEESAK